MRVRIRQSGALSVQGLVRGGLLASILLSCVYSLVHLRSLSLVEGDRKFITLEAGRGHEQAQRTRAAAGGGGAPSLDSSLARRDALLAAWPHGRPRAAIVVLSRNIDLGGVMYSMEQLERRFNAKAQYPYVFLNDQPHTAAFSAGVANATSAPCLFGQVPREHWNYPAFIDQGRAAAARAKMEEQGVVYGGSESYRHMCRYFSGFFFRHPLLHGFDYYWRLEPAVDFTCDLQQDPFVYLQEHNVSYGWNIIVNEVMSTIPTLWDTVRQFILARPGTLAPNNSLAGLVWGEGELLRYSGCHFWSNFEIGRLTFFRSEAYLQFFEHLDRSGGFFYERWGDAPVHSLAAALLLPREQIHRFNEIGYQHGDWPHCPQEPEHRARCACNPAKDVNLDQSTCLEMLKTAVGIY